MIAIDQARIDAPDYPRSQEWWTGFVPVWVKATVHNDGTVTLEPSGDKYDYSSDDPCAIIHQHLSAAQQPSNEKSLAQWVRGLPRISVAIID